MGSPKPEAKLHMIYHTYSLGILENDYTEIRVSAFVVLNEESLGDVHRLSPLPHSHLMGAFK